MGTQKRIRLLAEMTNEAQHHSRLIPSLKLFDLLQGRTRPRTAGRKGRRVSDGLRLALPKSPSTIIVSDSRTDMDSWSKYAVRARTGFFPLLPSHRFCPSVRPSFCSSASASETCLFCALCRVPRCACLTSGQHAAIRCLTAAAAAVAEAVGTLNEGKEKGRCE